VTVISMVVASSRQWRTRRRATQANDIASVSTQNLTTWQVFCRLNRTSSQSSTNFPFFDLPSAISVPRAIFKVSRWSCMQLKVKAKVLFEPQGPMAALISVSIVLSQTPAEAASPRTRDCCIAWSACLAPSLCRYQFILLDDQRHIRIRIRM